MQLIGSLTLSSILYMYMYVHVHTCTVLCTNIWYYSRFLSNIVVFQFLEKSLRECLHGAWVVTNIDRVSRDFNEALGTVHIPTDGEEKISIVVTDITMSEEKKMIK